MVNHTSGSQTFDVLLKRLKQEALSQLQSEAKASGSTKPNDLPLEHKIILFKDTTRREKKGGVYGSGSMVSVVYSKKDGGSSSSMVGFSSAVKVVEIEQKVIQLENTLTRKHDEQDESINKSVKKVVGEAVGKAIKEMELRVDKNMKAIVDSCLK